MNCLECRELLHKRLDGEPIAQEAIEQHLSQCAVCRDQHAGALRLLESLKKTPAPQLPVNFASAITAEIMHDRRQRQQKMRRRVFATIALAASVLFLLILAYNWMPRTNIEPGPKNDLVKDGPKKTQPPPKEEPKHVDKHEPRSPITALTDRWADTTRDHAKVVMVGMNLDGMPPVAALPVDPSVREAGQDVSDGVQTVTRNARKALDFFARELPMPDMGEQKN